MEGTCKGRLTLEHAFIYAGKQIDAPWAIIWLCAYHHGVDEFQDNGDLQKDLNQFIALSRATDEDLAPFPKKNWVQIKRYLDSKYGHLKGYG